jgi:hypothetical protein
MMPVKPFIDWQFVCLLLLLLAADYCLAEAYRAVNPDENPPCPALDSASLFTCLNTPSFSCIVVLSDIKLNVTTFPPTLSRDHAQHHARERPAWPSHGA